MPPSLHSELGASGASRWMACPASVRLSRLAAEMEHKSEKSSIFANEGSVAHSVCERLLSGEDVDALVGTEEEYGGDIITIDEEMVRCAHLYASTIKYTAGEDAELQIEKRFSLDWLYGGMFGTCDCCARDDWNGVLYIFDFKYGRGHAVHAKRNPQLMYYALGVLGPESKENESIKKVVMTIVQPRNKEVGIDSFTISKDDLYRWAFTELLPAAKRTEDENAECNPGDEQCKFCRGVPVCPAQYDRSMRMVKEFFPVIEEPASPTEVVKVELPPVAALAPEQVSRAMNLFAVLKSYLESVEESALERMKAGETIPGFKLVHKRSSTKWADAVAAENMLREHLGDDCWKKRELISPAEARKRVDKSVVSVYTTTVKGAITLAPEDDKREAVTPEQAALFEKA